MCRLLLGVTESGTFPGMWFHLSLFYTGAPLCQAKQADTNWLHGRQTWVVACISYIGEQSTCVSSKSCAVAFQVSFISQA